MITVHINGAQATLEEAVSGGWITEQLQRRHADGQSPCVRVDISAQGAHLTLATPSCAGTGGGGGRRASAQEREILDLWERHKLGEGETSPGELQAFLRRLSQIL